MTALRTIIFACVALLPFATTIRAADLADHIVFEQGDTLCGRIGAAGAVERLSDRAHYEKVERDGKRWYILHRVDSERTWLNILECDSTGALQSVRTIADAQLHQTTAIEQAQFLADGRLFVTLHIDPSTSAAVAIDREAGNCSILIGHAFTPDPSGRHIAYFHEPEGGSQESDMTELWVDGKKACQLPAAQANGIAWTANGTAVSR